MSDLSRRNIVREHEFDEQLRALIRDEESADDFTAGAELLLSMQPQAGTFVAHYGETSVWYLPMNTVEGRRVSLFYSFDDMTVLFVSILPHDD